MKQEEIVLGVVAMMVGLAMGVALESYASLKQLRAWHTTLPVRVVDSEPRWMLTCAAPSVLTGQGYVLTTVNCFDDAGTGTRMFADLVDSIRDGGSAGGAR